MLDVGLCTQVACIWEATARKVGNVHRGQDFEDVGYLDFLLSAAAIAPVMTGACQRRLGTTVLECVRATRRVVRSNTNLGMILLLAPLAAVPAQVPLREGVKQVLRDLDVEDAQLVYEAIRLARPGGLGKVPEQDVGEEPTETLRQVMARAGQRDLIAREYAGDFAIVFDEGVPAQERGLSRTRSLEDAIVLCHLTLLSQYPDSLIVRKRGESEARQASQKASEVLAAGGPVTPAGKVLLGEFDTWLRAEGHARNPGTTADLVTACLFVLLREGRIALPPDIPFATPGAFG
jgi:triphosphoribosyl-dephospho-CoA synthase